MKRKLLSLLTAAGLCLGLTGYAGAASFPDVSDADTALAVEVLSGLGIVSGGSDGNYYPDQGLTRAQFCKLAVLAGGHGDQVSGSAYRTLFSDVAGSHWAAPYINLACEEGLVSGYGNGTFGPDDPVTVGQAVTVVLRLLGYTTDQVGPFWPEDYMALGEQLGLLEGVSGDPDHALTRGEAALLLYALLGQSDSAGRDYIDNLCASKVENAVLLDADAESGDGTEGMVEVYANQNLSWYEPAAELEGLAGSRGTLLLDQSGRVSGFLPDDTVRYTLIPESVTANRINSSYAVSSTTPVVVGDTLTTFENCWYDLESCSQLTLYYNQSGNLELVAATERTAYAGVTLTGYYESASPNTAAPDTITLLGMELEVEESAVDSLSGCSVGDKITVTLNGDGAVISAAAGGQTTLYGVLGEGQVELTCGLTARGTISGSAGAGDLVKVTSSGVGKLSVSQVSGGSSLDLNVSEGTLGSIPLADNVRIYERAGTSVVTEIDLEDIQSATVKASDIDFYVTDSNGLVSVLLLDDVTGSAYTYGLLTMGSRTEGSGGMTYTNRTVSVENGGGTTQEYITGQSGRTGTMGGIAVSSEGKAVSLVTLSQAEDVSQSAFDGLDAVVIDGVRVPISDTAEGYNSDTEQWVTLSQARAYSDTFAVYYSGTLGVDAVVRVVAAE
ncbi:hypothetical protein B5E56_13255 [Flavonifractor sp. An112]|uniref:S-layer homology domain-containing protein n=1 Tax=Flavonifractor sp. An112 TaxID=1965544 RepID=UPI000B38CA4A|nr:S-layer homology domain-containing protein [Flavonifractor sp. An112]OUQ56265.1 hypothetical protein B5E56_13255 [Flavonifractor sp. An112]